MGKGILPILLNLQQNLKVLKLQRNNHGNYNFRSVEDINQAIKPLLGELGAVITLTDEVTMIGERSYIKATATLMTEFGEVSCIGFAREAEEQRGMNSAQLTGSTSSYARKYALNGLLAIDDNRDADDYISEEERAMQEEEDRQNAVDGVKTLIASLPIDKQKEELAWVLENQDITDISNISYRGAKIVYKAIQTRNKK